MGQQGKKKGGRAISHGKGREWERKKTRHATKDSKKQRSKGLCCLLSRPVYLHGHEAIIDKNLLSQEIGTDGGLVLVAELFVNILVHQRGLSDTIYKNKEKPLLVTSVRFNWYPMQKSLLWAWMLAKEKKIAWLENHNYNPLEKKQGYALQRRRRKKKKGRKEREKEKPRCMAKRMLSSSFDKVTLVQSVTALGLNSCFSGSFCFLTHSRRE